MRRAAGAALALVAAIACAGSRAQTVKVTGLAGQTVSLSVAEMGAMPHESLTVTLDDKTVTYSGVPLSKLLALVGAPSGKALKGPELADAVVVSASDGYRVVLGLAETDPAVRKDAILLADFADDAPLPEDQAPFRLVIEGDLRGARMVRKVTGISVMRVGAEP